jgi:hypothetical protein
MNYYKNLWVMACSEIKSLRQPYDNPTTTLRQCGLLHCRLELERILAIEHFAHAVMQGRERVSSMREMDERDRGGVREGERETEDPREIEREPERWRKGEQMQDTEKVTSVMQKP